MKKIIATALSLTMFSVSLLGTACKKNEVASSVKPIKPIEPIVTAQSLKGTNGAKLLLANENLDETVFTDVDFWDKMGDGQQATSTVKATAYRGAGSVAKPTDMTQEGEYTYWKSFDNYSQTMDLFDSVMEQIEKNALDVAENIGWFKKNVGITDKWVDGQTLLQVEENVESLYVKHDYETWKGFDVAHRQTRADAKNVYETYQYVDDFGGKNPVVERRMLFIPNEYYEWSMWEHVGVLNSYVMENCDGLWKMTRTYYDSRKDTNMNRDQYFSFDHYVLKDGYGLGFNYLTTCNEGQVLESEIKTYNLFDMENENELYNVIAYPQDKTYWVDVFMSNVESGVDGLRALTSDVQVIPTGKGDQWWIDSSDVVLTGGEVIEDGAMVRQIIGEKAFGWMPKQVRADNLGAALVQSENEWNARDVQFKIGAADLGDFATYVELLGNEFADTYEWNGFKIVRSLEDFDEGIAWLHSYYDQKTALYNAVKDNEQVETSQVDLSNTHFAGLTIEGNATYADGTVSVAEITAMVEENALLETNVDYVVRFGLALRDGMSFDTTRTVPLETANAQTFTYNGEGVMILTGSGEYALPAEISEGEYVVVAYVATANEGVRVSEMQVVGFTDVVGDRLNVVEMDVTLHKSQTNELVIHYAVKNILEVTLDGAKTYGIEEIEKILLDAVLMSGYPILSETVEQTADGYRLKCLLPVEGQLKEAYVYCVLPKTE